MIKYANDYFIMFMNIDEIKRRKPGKLRVFTYQITHISAADIPKVANLMPNYYKDTVDFIMVEYANCLIYIFMNINENI